MKICFCNTIHTWGGGEKWHYEMASALSENQHEVHFILHEGGQIDHKLNDRIRKKYLPIGKLSFLNPIKYYNLVRFFKTNQFDAILINAPSELKLVARAAKKGGVKKVIYRRGSDVVVKNKFLNRYLLEKKVDAIIANSKATKASLIKTGINIEHKIEVINNGIHPPKEQIAQVGNEMPVIGAVGRLAPEKGFDLLLQAAKKLKAQNVSFKLKIAGEGDERTNLQGIINDEDLSHEVELVGFINDVYGFLNSCDVFALSSRYEGFGYVMVEAMFTKLPVVAYDNSAAKEIVVDGETGLLCPSFNVEQFYKGLKSLVESPSLRKDLGNKGAERALEKYHFNISVDKILSLITT